MITGRRKSILIITFVFWTLSIYSALQMAGEVASSGDEETSVPRWVVRAGDTIAFECFINSNASSQTLVDPVSYTHLTLPTKA